MQHLKHHKNKGFRGISLKLDIFFFRNLVLIVSAVFIWRGIWNLLDYYGPQIFSYSTGQILSHAFVADNIFSIILGIIMMYLIDTHLEPPFEENQIKKS